MTSTFLQDALGQNLTNISSPLDLTGSFSSFQFARSFDQDKSSIQNGGLAASILSNSKFQDLSSAANLIKTNYLLVSLIASSLLLLSVLALRGSRSVFGVQIFGGKSRGDDEKVLRPPVVNIPTHILFSSEGHDAYNRALEEHGDVVIVPRHGRMEYVLDVQHVKEVLTDAKNYSFEKAVTSMMHMEFVMWFKNGTFVQELDQLVQTLTNRLPSVIETLQPVFNRESEELLRKHQNGSDLTEGKIDDLYEWVHWTIGRAMCVLILGEEYLDDQTTECFMAVVAAIADLGGIYANTSWWAVNFPKTWSLFTSLKAIFWVIVPRFFLGILPKVYRNLDTLVDAGINKGSTDFVPLIAILASKHRDVRTGYLSFLNFIWVSVIALGVIFASIHQTAVVAVWVIMTLTLKPQHVNEIREEIEQVLDVDDEGRPVLSAEGLRKAEKLDSFIREVMRTKGDTFAPLRTTTREVKVGKYTLPAGALVTPYVKRIHEHPSNYGDSGKIFDGHQWIGDKPAVMSTPEFVSFGLGRWQCPGKHLAIMEIKMIVSTLFHQYDLRLKDDKFQVVDPMNATSRAPDSVTFIKRRALPLQASV